MEAKLIKRSAYIVASTLCILMAASSAGGQVTYTYDEHGRLKTGDYYDGQEIEYSYDIQDNRLSVAVEDGIEENRNPAALNPNRSAIVDVDEMIPVTAIATDLDRDTLQISAATLVEGTQSGTIVEIVNATTIRFRAANPGNYEISVDVSDPSGNTITSLVIVNAIAGSNGSGPSSSPPPSAPPPPPPPPPSCDWLIISLPTQTDMQGENIGVVQFANIEHQGGLSYADFPLSVSGLPAGLSFSAETNTITGAPSEFGTFQVSVSIYDQSCPASFLNSTFPWTIHPTDISCQEGYSEAAHTQSCQRSLNVEVDVDYQFKADEFWTGSSWQDHAWLSSLKQNSSCVPEYAYCVQPETQQYQSYKCQTGANVSTQSRSCDRELNVTVDVDYQYKADQHWTGSAWQDHAWLTAVKNSTCSFQYDYCAVSGSGPGSCSVKRHAYRCENTVPAVGWGASREYRDIVWEGWTQPSSCTSIQSDSSCALSGWPCLSQANETRNINGLNVTRSCWHQQLNYSCSTSTPINTCNPPAGAQFAGEVCLQYLNGQCVLTEKEYNVPIPLTSPNGCVINRHAYRCEGLTDGDGNGWGVQREYRHIESRVWDEPATCTAIQSDPSCELSNWPCSGTPNEIRNINGLDVTESCWDQQLDYTCTSRQDVDTCSIPTGAGFSLQNQSCAWADATGTCRLFDKTYSAN